MIFDISHSTVYRYSAPVAQSHHLLHLQPRLHPRQKVLSYSLFVDPAPASKTDLTDDFGNPVSIVAIEQDHTTLTLLARARVDVEAQPDYDAAHSSAWNDVAAQLRANLGPETYEAIVYTCPSRFIRPSREVHKFARGSFAEGRPLLEAVSELTARIHQGFAYEAGSTDAATPVEEVLRLKKGVCQDFAHVEIACLRAMGLAARYVSGYLLTYPPEGQPKLVGADASHAWVSVWAAELGWVDFDPTNNMRPREEHVALAYGRDYHDVSPVSGVLLGGGEHEVAVSVDVSPVEGA
jgi:transglutaminase-like putative cysteine protease